MTDLRDQIAHAILLSDRRRLGNVLWRLRHAAGMSAAGLGHRIGVSRAGIYRRENVGYMPASELIEHLDALGYDLVAVPRTSTHLEAA